MRQTYQGWFQSVGHHWLGRRGMLHLCAISACCTWWGIMPLCQLSSFISPVPGCSDCNLCPWGDIACTCMCGQLHVLVCEPCCPSVSLCLGTPILRGCFWGECRHWTLCLIQSQPDRAAQGANYPLVLLQPQGVTGLWCLSQSSVPAIAALFLCTLLCRDTVCAVCANPFLEQWASFCLSLWLFLRLKLKITFLPKLHLALSAQKGIISQARTGSYIPIISFSASHEKWVPDICCSSTYEYLVHFLYAFLSYPRVVLVPRFARAFRKKKDAFRLEQWA